MLLGLGKRLHRFHGGDSCHRHSPRLSAKGLGICWRDVLCVHQVHQSAEIALFASGGFAQVSVTALMSELLVQLAMAALGQFGASPAMPISGVRPIVPVSRPLPQFPGEPTAVQTSSLQLASLATATCLMREGQLNRQQALDLLDRQAQAWGWRTQWGQRIPLASVDRAISAGGGCAAIVGRIRTGRASIPPMATFPSASGNGDGRSRSEREGFGLFPYR